MNKKNNYDASSLITLKGLEAVRKRPGMYIGSTDENGLHHLIWEILDNSIDEVLSGFANEISLTLKKGGSVIVEDNGRGIPVDKNKESGKSGVELVFTELHAGGKFGQSQIYKTSGGLHGVGSSVVNALSRKVVVNVYRDGKEYETKFADGEIVQKTKAIGTTNKRGTKVTFWPEYDIFKDAQFNFKTIYNRLREKSFLNPKLKIKFHSEIKDKTVEFYSEKGIVDFIDYINESKTKISPVVNFEGKENDIILNVCFQYTQDYNETIVSFVNNINTINGGSHEIGFKTMFTKIINDYARQLNLLKAKDSNLEGSDIREGMTAIISLQIPENILEFVGQTKESLRTVEAKTAIENLLVQKLIPWLKENKNVSQKIIEKTILASKARHAAKKARDEARSMKKSLKNQKIISSKLTPAQSKNKLERELFLVEGNSAGGSAKNARDHYYQAILPLRGKVINSEKNKLIDILKNEEILTIINTVGAGIGRDFDIEDAGYGKIIIMTDADTDGAHIQTLLLTFFFKYMRPLIQAKRVYIALPPLFKVKMKNNKQIYLWTEDELYKLQKADKIVEIQRYKGLGEMNPDQLWETTMNPETRFLIQVSLKDVSLAERKVSTLMGDQIDNRKKWINENIEFTLEDNFINYQENKAGQNEN